MPYDENLAKRINAALKIFPEKFTEKRMFGGLAFLLEGKMTIGTINEDLMVRVIPEKISHELRKNFVRPMDFTGKPMKEFIFVTVEGYHTEEQLQYWIELGVEHAKNKLKK